MIVSIKGLPSKQFQDINFPDMSYYETVMMREIKAAFKLDDQVPQGQAGDVCFPE